MSATYVSNLVINTGEDFTQQFTLQSADNSPLDLTNYTASSQLRKHPGSSTATDFNTLISDPPTFGVITIKLTSSQTTNLKPGRHVYDVVIERSGEKSRVIEGSVIIRQGVTR